MATHTEVLYEFKKRKEINDAEEEKERSAKKQVKKKSSGKNSYEGKKRGVIGASTEEATLED